MLVLWAEPLAERAVSTALALVIARGLTRTGGGTERRTLGNFWVDLVRALVYVLLPLCIAGGLLLDAGGLPSSYLFAALVVGLAIALARPGELDVPQHVFRGAQAVAGVSLGAYLESDALRALASSWLPVALVSLATLGLSLLCGEVLARTTPLDPPTAGASQLTYVFAPIDVGPHRGSTAVTAIQAGRPHGFAGRLLGFVVGTFAARTAEGALRDELDALAAACAEQPAGNGTHGPGDDRSVAA